MWLILEFKVEVYPRGFLLSKGANLSSQYHTEKSQSTGPACASLSVSQATAPGGSRFPHLLPCLFCLGGKANGGTWPHRPQSVATSQMLL